MRKIILDSSNMHYKALNEKINEKLDISNDFIINNVCGQRYIGAGITKNIKITVNGTPGNDLGAFMDGPEIVINGNAQDAIGNTMNSGEIIVHGNAGDIAGYSMRGGKIYVKGNAGYRVGIHMKAYKDKFPVVIIGGETRDFLGEYMAGGLLIVLGLNSKHLPAGDFVGTGMHGGIIFIRTEKIDPRLLGKEVKAGKLDAKDKGILKQYVKDYCEYFGLDQENILKSEFIKLYPYSHRPYGRLYAY